MNFVAILLLFYCTVMKHFISLIRKITQTITLKTMATEITRIHYKGTEIVKIENELPFDNGIFEDDFIYGSFGFFRALNNGLTPTLENTGEWHHFFTKENDGFKCNKINFK